MTQSEILKAYAKAVERLLREGYTPAVMYLLGVAHDAQRKEGA